MKQEIENEIIGVVFHFSVPISRIMCFFAKIMLNSDIGNFMLMCCIYMVVGEFYVLCFMLHVQIE